MPNNIKISNITPAEMVKNYDDTSFFAKRKNYSGLWIKVRGVIEEIITERFFSNRTMKLESNYATFIFRDKDGISVFADLEKNFDVDDDMSLFKKGMKIGVVGQVNSWGVSVRLEHCKLINVLTDNQVIIEDSPQQIDIIKTNKWWEKTWVQIIMLLGSVASLIGVYSFFK